MSPRRVVFFFPPGEFFFCFLCERSILLPVHLIFLVGGLRLSLYFRLCWGVGGRGVLSSDSPSLVLLSQLPMASAPFLVYFSLLQPLHPSSMSLRFLSGFAPLFASKGLFGSRASSPSLPLFEAEKIFRFVPFFDVYLICRSIGTPLHFCIPPPLVLCSLFLVLFVAGPDYPTLRPGFLSCQFLLHFSRAFPCLATPFAVLPYFPSSLVLEGLEIFICV